MIWQNILLNTLGGFLFIFLLWKKLRDDCTSNQVFSLAFSILFGIFISVFIASRFIPAGWFWFTILGIAIGLLVSHWRHRILTYEALEATSIGLLPWIALHFFQDAVNKSSMWSFFFLVFLVFLAGLYVYLDRHYKRFGWYRSGRIGFSGLSILAIFFLGRTIVAIFGNSVLSFWGSYDGIISAILSFLFFLTLYNLAKQK